MKKKSLKQRIEDYGRKQYPEWINGGRYEELAMSIGYKASTASRRCREMTSGLLSDGKTCPIILEKKEREGSVWYRYIPQKRVVFSTEIVYVDGERKARIISKVITI